MAKSQDFSTNSGRSEALDFARQARLTVRQAFTGCLATLDIDGGFPFASLVTVAVSAEGDPLLLLSGLARHTKNIRQHSKASLLLEAPLAVGDPLAVARVTVQGEIAPTHSETVRNRFLARHPEAEGYADFTDFAFYKLQVSSVHFIAGFGRIHSFAREAVCLDATKSDQVWEDVQCAAQSETHQDALKKAWRRQIGSEPQDVGLKIVAMDGDGLDVRAGEAVQRLNFYKVSEDFAELESSLPDVLA